MRNSRGRDVDPGLQAVFVRKCFENAEMTKHVPAFSSSSSNDMRSFYRDHVLSCQPMRLEDGRYEARVVIITMSRNKARSQRFLDLEAFESEDAAIERARRAGMEWVDANIDGGAPRLFR
jgi:hypothetical protein